MAATWVGTERPIERSTSFRKRWVPARRVGGAQASDPMVEMNTTPLIDVMLVLLIMLIITIPSQTHSVKVDLPGTPPERDVVLHPVKNRLTISAQGSAIWNGTPVGDAQLRRLLAQSAVMEPWPELHFEPDAATRYERVDAVMAMVRQSGVRAFGFVGNERYRDSF